ncbi:MAG: hypothetical protein LBB90_11570 [Tannerella sp.]|nr:hypothetical protein [Tannerella sp.]
MVVWSRLVDLVTFGQRFGFIWSPVWSEIGVWSSVWSVFGGVNPGKKVIKSVQLFYYQVLNELHPADFLVVWSFGRLVTKKGHYVDENFFHPIFHTLINVCLPVDFPPVSFGFSASISYLCEKRKRIIMPRIEKVFSLEITPEQYLENCSAGELEELLWLLSSDRFQARIQFQKGRYGLKQLNKILLL